MRGAPSLTCDLSANTDFRSVAYLCPLFQACFVGWSVGRNWVEIYACSEIFECTKIAGIVDIVPGRMPQWACRGKVEVGKSPIAH